MTAPTQDLVSSARDTLRQTQRSADRAWDIENRSFTWGAQPSTLTTTSTVESYAVGTGKQLFQNVLLPALESAEQEVILVTCFWAKSASLELLADSLRHLSEKAIRRGDGSKIRVFIGLSSRSLWQKLMHTSDPSGFTYPPSTWTSQLGLPSSAELQGLEVTIKSRFFRPFSVMHPKYLIVDRRKLWMPSCNVSWEAWYEGCVALHGPVVHTALEIWSQFWRVLASQDIASDPAAASGTRADREGEGSTLQRGSSEGRSSALPRELSTTLLPSQHHASLSLSFPTWFMSEQKPPPTPLNMVLLHLFTKARRSIALTTPNLTCPPVVDALLTAVGRGIDVSITSNRRMMLMEQLVTSFTITEFWVWKLVRAYKKLQARGFQSRNPSHGIHYSRLIEEGRTPSTIGQLEIHYFCPASTSDGSDAESPVKSHVKCTIVDDSVIVLGSGNQDRASWFTSQELGIAIQDEEAARHIGGQIKDGLKGKTRQVFPAVAR